MSKIDDLIRKFCPDGVEYKSIKSLAEVGTGSSNGNEAQEDGEYPFFIRSQTVKRKNEWEYDEEAIIIPGEGGIGEIYHYVNGKYAIHQRVYRIHFIDDSVDVKFAYHYFRGFFKNFIMRKAVSATVKSIRKPMIEEFMLPVPPLEVQREIVHILDSFTLLTAELTAELTARKSQYEFYRRKLLTFDESIPQLQLRDVASFRNGKGHEKNIADNGKYVVVNSKFISTNGQVIKNSDEQLSPLYFDDIAMVMSDLPNGRALAKCYLIDKDDKFTLNQRIGGFHTLDENIVVTKYLFYILDRNWQLLKYDNGVDQTNLKKDDILNISIPVPAIDVQKRLVYMLDNFDAICSDLNIGLPAEIEARQKQYEYYRDVLLTYAATGKIIAQTDRQA